MSALGAVALSLALAVPSGAPVQDSQAYVNDLYSSAPVLAFWAVPGTEPDLSGVPYAYAGPSTLPAVESATLPDALSACYHAYGTGSGTPNAFVYADCVNAAYAHFDGRHSKLWNN